MFYMIHPTEDGKFLKILESSERQNLNFPSTNNYLHDIYPEFTTKIDPWILKVLGSTTYTPKSQYNFQISPLYLGSTSPPKIQLTTDFVL